MKTRVFLAVLVFVTHGLALAMAEQPPRLDLVPQTGHTAGVTAVAFRPDADQVLTGSQDGSAILWDAKTGRQLRKYVAAPLPNSFLAVLEMAEAKVTSKFPLGSEETPAIVSLLFSPDGKRFVMIGEAEGFAALAADVLAMVWETDSGRLIHAFPLELSSDAVALSPDGKQLLTGGYSIMPEDVADATRMGIKVEARNAVMLRDLATGKMVRQFGRPEFMSCNAVDFSADGRLVLASVQGNAGGPPVQQEKADPQQSSTAGKPPQNKQPGPSGLVCVWETSTGKQVGEFRTRNVPKTVAFSPSGDSILLVPQIGDAELFDAKTGKPRLDLGACAAAAFTPDGLHVVTVSKDGNVCVRKVADGAEARRFRTGLSGVNRIAMSRDGSRLAMAMTHEWPTDAKQPMPNALGEAALLDLTDGRILRTFLSQNDAVDFVAFTPDGNRFLAGDGLWNPTSGGKIGNLCKKPVAAFSAAFDADGKRAVVANHPRSKFLSGLFEGWFSRPRGNDIAVVVEIPSGKQTARLEADSVIRDHVALGVGPDRDNAITVAENKIGVWNIASGKNLLKHPVDGFVRAVDVCPRRGWVGMLVDNVTTAWWDVKTGERVSAEGRKKGKSCCPGGPVAESGDKKEPQIDLSEDGQSLIVRSANLPDGSRTLKIDTQPHKEIRSRGFDAKEHRYVFADLSSLHVGLWDAATGKMLREFASDNPFLAKPMAFSPDGRRLALTGEEGLITIWETESGKKLAQIQFDSPIMAVAFSPDGARLAAGCADRTVVIAPLTDGPKQVLHGHGGPVTAVAFRPDGALLLTASRNDGTARLWSLTDGKEIAKIISLNNRNDWLVMTPDGAYDGSEGGCRQMAFRVGEGLDVRPADQFSAEAYQPRKGLLKMIWDRK